MSVVRVLRTRMTDCAAGYRECALADGKAEQIHQELKAFGYAGSLEDK